MGGVTRFVKRRAGAVPLPPRMRTGTRKKADIGEPLFSQAMAYPTFRLNANDNFPFYPSVKMLDWRKTLC
jgi:hypothetical protein